MRLIDMHCDTISEMFGKQDVHLKRNQLCVDLEKMKQAGSAAQFFACFIDVRKFQSEKCFSDGYDYALDMITYAKEEFRNYTDEIGFITSWEEFEHNSVDGKLSAILTIEEGGILDGNLQRLVELYRQGIRLVTLTWNFENCIGYPNSRNATMMQKGLKQFGIEVVENMNHLGMLIDVSHLSDGGFWDVLRYSKKPVVASHSNARALCNHPRNMTDEMLRALASKGGIVGVNFYPYFVQETGKATVEDLCHHIKHMYHVGGEDCVAIGADFDGFHDGTLEVVHIGDMERLYYALGKCGFSERQIEKICSKNVIRVLKEI